MRHYCSVNSRSTTSSTTQSLQPRSVSSLKRLWPQPSEQQGTRMVAVQKALPAVCDSLRTVTGVVKIGLESKDSSMRCMNSSMRHMERRMATLENVVTNFCSGAFTFTPGSRGVQEPQPPPIPAAAGPMPAPTAIESLEEQPPTHRLSRGATKITDLWEEWTVGLGGQPSVEDLDERWGSRWWHGAEFQFYSRRKVVITEIKRLVAGGREAREVVDSLEAQRVRIKEGILELSD